MITIYKYTNTLNNKVYVGQTTSTPEKRAKKNGKGYIHCKHFYSAILKYGWLSFKLEILEQVDSNVADEREQFYIKFFNSTNPEFGYNLDLGGCAEKIRSEQTKQKISDSGKGLKNSRAKNVCVNGIPTNKTIRDYAKEINISENTLKTWCKENKNGYSYF